MVLVHNTTRAELEERLRSDPFVAQDAVTIELLEVASSRADPRLGFLLSDLSGV